MIYNFKNDTLFFNRSYVFQKNVFRKNDCFTNRPTVFPFGLAKTTV